MSMYRQLWFAIATSMLLALLGSLLASTLGARAYLTEQLTIKNADNAAALALALSQQGPDAAMVEAAVAALYDSGHYESVRIIDPFGKTVVERQAAAGGHEVPAWFVRLLPIVGAPGEAEISSGWKQVGTVVLVSHSRFAYQALWRSVWQLAAAMAVAALVAGYLGSLILGRLRRPLAAVIGQAEAIIGRRFVTIPEPTVPELRQLAVAMNSAVLRLRAMFAEEASRLDAVRREANCDSLTGLANRNLFMARLQDALAGESSRGGSIVLVRVAHLGEVNRRLGRVATDELLRRFGAALAQAAAQRPDSLAARLNGADFALLLPDGQQPLETAERLLDRLRDEAEAYVGDGPTAFVGVVGFSRGTEVAALLAQADAALAAVEAEGRNGIREAKVGAADVSPRTVEDWRQLIGRALERNWLGIVLFPVVDMKEGVTHQECYLRLKADEEGEWMSAGQFLPMAERLKLTAQLDLAAVELALRRLAADTTATELAVNLSANSIQDEDFRRELEATLRMRPALASRLWLEVGETGVLRHLEAFSAMCRQLGGRGCRIGIEHFGRQFGQVGELYDLGIDYVKVDGSFARSLAGSPGNQAFLSGLSAIVHGLGAMVICEGIDSEADLRALAGIGFDGATGPAVKMTSN